MTSTTTAYTVVVPGTHLMSALCGPRDVFLRQVEAAFPGATIVVRGNEVHLDGPGAAVAGRLVEELVLLLQRAMWAVLVQILYFQLSLQPVAVAVVLEELMV